MKKDKKELKFEKVSYEENLFMAKLKGKKKTDLFFFILDTPKKWAVEVNVESCDIEEKIADTKFCKCTYPTIESCIAPSIKLAFEYMDNKVNSEIEIIKKKFNPTFQLLDSAIDSTIK